MLQFSSTCLWAWCHHLHCLACHCAHAPLAVPEYSWLHHPLPPSPVDDRGKHSMEVGGLHGSNVTHVQGAGESCHRYYTQFKSAGKRNRTGKSFVCQCPQWFYSQCLCPLQYLIVAKVIQQDKLCDWQRQDDGEGATDRGGKAVDMIPCLLLSSASLQLAPFPSPVQTCLLAGPLFPSPSYTMFLLPIY